MVDDEKDQLGLFDPLASPVLLPPSSPPDPPSASSDPDGLRSYQREAVTSIQRELQENRSTLLVMATGTGKTQVFVMVAKNFPGRTLVLAHRDELILQAANRFEQMTGRFPEIEKAESFASPRGTKTVVASVQSLQRTDRLELFGPDAFGLVIVDECHHSVAASYRKILDYFSGAKLLGASATPDRLDGAALGQIFESVAYQYDINQAIRDGWLCPIVAKAIHVDTIDLSKVKKIAGDFNQGELDTIMALEKNLHAVAKPAVDLSGDRKTIVFTTSVSNAHRLAEIINRYVDKEVAMAVDGSTDMDERRHLIEGFRSSRWKYFVNVGIATEGADFPDVACVVMGRPTQSRALYSQMLGRGSRIAPGKQDLLVLDFVGNVGKHRLVSSVDALSGSLSDDVRDRAQALIEKADEPMSVEQAIAEAEKQHEAARQREIERLHEEQERFKRRPIVGEVTYAVSTVDPFESLGIRRDYLTERYGVSPATEKQIEHIKKFMKKDAKDLPENLSKSEASRMIGELHRRIDDQRCSYPQMRLLQKRGYDAKDWSFSQARRVIDAIANNGWRALSKNALQVALGESSVVDDIPF
jgi:superfamily II DNA or RNA helicase